MKPSKISPAKFITALDYKMLEDNPGKPSNELSSSNRIGMYKLASYHILSLSGVAWRLKKRKHVDQLATSPQSKLPTCQSPLSSRWVIPKPATLGTCRDEPASKWRCLPCWLLKRCAKFHFFLVALGVQSLQAPVPRALGPGQVGWYCSPDPSPSTLSPVNLSILRPVNFRKT